MNSFYFPFPSKLEEVTLIFDSNADVTARSLYDLFASGGVTELPELTGASNPKNGSGKLSSRFIKSKHWFFKTDISKMAFSTLGEAIDHAVYLRAEFNQIPVWHPSKFWFAIHKGTQFYLVSGCPVMQTLRDLQYEPILFLNGFEEILRLGYQVSENHSVTLDMNPSNFGRQCGDGPFYYLDDEIYLGSSAHFFAESITRRITEYPNIPASGWIFLLNKFKENFSGSKSAFSSELEFEVCEIFNSLGNPSDLNRANVPESHKKRISKKVAILADIHGNAEALERVIYHASQNGISRFMVLGDVVGYGPNPSSCIKILQTLPDVEILKGNHDEFISTGIFGNFISQGALAAASWHYSLLSETDKQWLKELPDTIIKDNILHLHGAPVDKTFKNGYVYDMTYKENLDHIQTNGYSICFYGHTHLPFIYEKTEENIINKEKGTGTVKLNPNSVYLINPGSVGQPRDFDTRASYLVFDQSTRTVTFHRIEYSLSTIIEQYIHSGLDPEIISKLVYRLKNGI